MLIADDDAFAACHRSPVVMRCNSSSAASAVLRCKQPAMTNPPTQILTLPLNAPNAAALLQ
jgi:hypothetical protein